jgi:hypothetical protein
LIGRNHRTSGPDQFGHGRGGLTDTRRNIQHLITGLDHGHRGQTIADLLRIALEQRPPLRSRGRNLVPVSPLRVLVSLAVELP